MKNRKLGITAALLGLAFAAASFAAAAAPAKALHTSGKITAVDATAMSVTIAAAAKSETIFYTATTVIQENGKPVAASTLAVGAQVKIAYEVTAEKNVAQKIEIGVAAKPANKPK